MNSFPPIVGFFITSRCNNDCAYCYGPKRIKDMSLSTINRVIKLLADKGVKGILLTGGEPTIREDFKEIVKEIKKYKLNLFLDTSGDYFFKYKNLITDNVDFIGLPLDFPDASYRRKNNLKKVFKILDYFKDSKNHPKVKIGTVVTKDNIKKLRKIANMINLYPLDLWKIRQFIPQNVNAVKNKRALEVSQKEFDSVTRKIKKEFSDLFKVIISKRKDKNRAYFFIYPDGVVYVPVDESDICFQKKVGHIFDPDIVDKWWQVVSKSNYSENARQTFSPFI